MNITIDMGEILTKAWKIIWKFKVLWIFGILAGCGANNGGNYNFNNGLGNGFGSGNGSNGGNIPTPFKQFMDMQPGQALQAFVNQYLAIIVGVVLLLCVIWLLVYFLGIMGKTGLIKGVGKADGGAETLGFGELWTEGLPYLWRMVGVSLLVGLPFFIIIVVLLVVFLSSLMGFMGNSSSGGAFAGLLASLGVFIPAICCLSILSVVVGMIAEQAKNAIVFEDKGVIESLKRGWEIFKTSFLTIILIAVILAVLSGIVGFIISIPVLLIVIPALGGIVLFSSAHAASSNAVIGPLLIAGGCFLLYLPVLIVLRGIEQSYIQSVWTLTFRRLTAPTPAAPAAALPETADAA